MKENKRKLLKDIVFCLWLGFEVIGVFLLAVIAGLWLDDYFNSKPCWILVLLIGFYLCNKVIVRSRKR